MPIIQSENLKALKRLAKAGKRYELIYIDPPYNTGRTQRRGEMHYPDKHRNFIDALSKRLAYAHMLLSSRGSIFVHIDPKESHYVKVELDRIFGRENFRNELIWAYDYGGRSKKVWPQKHDVIFWYTKGAKYVYNYDAIDRIPYLAPSLCGRDKAKRGKTPTDVWWNTIVHTNGREKTGYPTQKPLAILQRIVRVHSNRGDRCLDFYAGSGSFGEACRRHHRKVYLIDQNPQAIRVMKKRLKKYGVKVCKLS